MAVVNILATEHRSHVEHLPDRVGTDHARVPEERVDGGISGREQRSGVRGGGALAGSRAPALDGDDRFVGGNAARYAPELGRVAERLEVEGNYVRALVRLPVLKEIVTGQVGLVAGRYERGQADTVTPGKVEGGDAERATLGGEAHPAGRRRAGREARVQRDRWVGVDHAEAVGTHEAHAGGPAHGDELALTSLARFAHLGEPRRQDHEGTHACCSAVASDVDDASTVVEELQAEPDEDPGEKLDELKRTLEDASEALDELNEDE